MKICYGKYLLVNKINLNKSRCLFPRLYVEPNPYELQIDQRNCSLALLDFKLIRIYEFHILVRQLKFISFTFSFISIDFFVLWYSIKSIIVHQYVRIVSIFNFF